jgi:hypothetical protein
LVDWNVISNPLWLSATCVCIENEFCLFRNLATKYWNYKQTDVYFNFILRLYIITEMNPQNYRLLVRFCLAVWIPCIQMLRVTNCLSLSVLNYFQEDGILRNLTRPPPRAVTARGYHLPMKSGYLKGRQHNIPGPVFLTAHTEAEISTASTSLVPFQNRKLQTNSVASVHKRTIPTERPQPVGEVSANFCG